MTIIVPSWLTVVAYIAVGFVLGAAFAKWWAGVWAIHNREAAPVWIPWRRIPCDQCFKDGQEYERRYGGRSVGGIQEP